MLDPQWILSVQLHKRSHLCGTLVACLRLDKNTKDSQYTTSCSSRETSIPLCAPNTKLDLTACLLPNPNRYACNQQYVLASPYIARRYTCKAVHLLTLCKQAESDLGREGATHSSLHTDESLCNAYSLTPNLISPASACLPCKLQLLTRSCT